MRVLLYSRAFPPAVGGMERFAEDLAGWLAGHGNEVWIATRTPAAARSDAQRLYRVMRGISATQFGAAARWADVVHVNGLALRAIVPAHVAGRRTVVTHAGHQAVCPTGLAWTPTRNCTAGPAPGPCRWCPRRGLMGRAAVAGHRLGTLGAVRNVCVSRYLQGRLGLPNSIVIYNPVSKRAFGRGTETTEPQGLIAFAGRLVAEKGLDLLLWAVAAMPDSRLEVGGEGPMRSAWEELTHHLGLGDRVKFLGKLAFGGVADLYARAAVVCVPSAWGEPFGYAAAEAMALGRPVVATPRGALPELLGDGRGFVSPACTPDALAEALRAALRDASARARAGALAREFALREFSIDRIGARYVATYEEAAA